MKCKGLFLLAFCCFGMTQVQDAQAMLSWFRKKPEPSKWEKAKPWLAGGAGVAVVGGVIALRKPIGEFVLSSSDIYQKDYHILTENKKGLKALKKKIKEDSEINKPLFYYNKGMNYCGLALLGAQLLNFRNDIGKRISDRLRMIQTIGSAITRDREYQLEEEVVGLEEENKKLEEENEKLKDELEEKS